MADYIISEFTLLDGKTVEIKDAVARAAIQGGTYFLGVTTTEITDGSTTSSVVIPQGSGKEPITVSVKNGNMVAYGNAEFVYSVIDGAWHELGDLSNLGDLAVKDEATGSYTPAGTVAFTGGTVNSTGTFTPEGTVSFTGGTVSSTGTFTPEGTVSFTGGTVSSTGTFTPQGTVSKPNVTVTPTTDNIDVFKTAGSVTAGSAASMTLPTWSATVVGERLVFSWDQGAFTANTPTAVTLPTSESVSVMTGASAELAATPTFTGTEGSVSVSGTAAGTAAFTGTEGNVSVSGTAAGTAAFTGTEGNVSVSGTAAGTAAFTGTAATITVS